MFGFRQRKVLLTDQAGHMCLVSAQEASACRSGISCQQPCRYHQAEFTHMPPPLSSPACTVLPDRCWSAAQQCCLAVGLGGHWMPWLQQAATHWALCSCSPLGHRGKGGAAQRQGRTGLWMGTRLQVLRLQGDASTFQLSSMVVHCPRVLQHLAHVTAALHILGTKTPGLSTVPTALAPDLPPGSMNRHK